MFYLIGTGVVCAVVGVLFLLTPFGVAVFFAFDDTTITFENGRGEPCTVTVTIIELEHGNRESEHRFDLSVQETKVIDVEHGIKTVQIVVDGQAGQIEFDQWNGEDVGLKIQGDGSLVQIWAK